MLDDIYQQTKGRMGKTITALKNELKRVRTGRASLSLLDGIRVDYYGTPTPLNQMATSLGAPTLIQSRKPPADPPASHGGLASSWRSRRRR